MHCRFVFIYFFSYIKPQPIKTLKLYKIKPKPFLFSPNITWQPGLVQLQSRHQIYLCIKLTSANYVAG